MLYKYYSMTNITIKLFYMDGCGPCMRFKGKWEELKEIIRVKSGKFGNMNIKTEEYENKKNKDVVDAEGINSFPTIMIVKDGKKIEYEGKREPNEILKSVGVIVEDNIMSNQTQTQKGGYKEGQKQKRIKDDSYKYEKYKKKYEDLKYKHECIKKKYGL